MDAIVARQDNHHKTLQTERLLSSGSTKIMSIIFNGHYRMKHRTWITEALRLHFEEHLPRVVAGRRLGVPKSTVCSMFVRFRRAGLSWPLPAGMSEQELDACLYGKRSVCNVL